MKLETAGRNEWERFDNAAKELFRDYSPRGMIAIVLDGEIKSTPVVQAEKFGGMGQVSGAASETEAKELALILQSGYLPFPIGRQGKKGPEPGVPAQEFFFSSEK